MVTETERNRIETSNPPFSNEAALQLVRKPLEILGRQNGNIDLFWKAELAHFLFGPHSNDGIKTASISIRQFPPNYHPYILEGFDLTSGCTGFRVSAGDKPSAEFLKADGAKLEDWDAMPEIHKAVDSFFKPNLHRIGVSGDDVNAYGDYLIEIPNSILNTKGTEMMLIRDNENGRDTLSFNQIWMNAEVHRRSFLRYLLTVSHEENTSPHSIMADAKRFMMIEDVSRDDRTKTSDMRGVADAVSIIQSFFPGIYPDNHFTPPPLDSR